MAKKLLLIIPGVLIIILGAVYLFANYRLKTVIDLRVEELIASGDYQEITYDSVALRFNGDITLENLYVMDSNLNEYILENIQISEFDYFSPVPHHLHLSAQGLRFPAAAPSFGDGPNNLLNNYIASMMDEDLLPLTMNYRYNYQPEDNDRMDIEADLALPASFFLSAEAQILNVRMEGINANAPASVSVMLQNADIPAALIALRDDGMVEAISALQGAALGTSGDEYRQQLLEQLQAAALFVPPRMQALAQDLLGNFAEFMTGEKTLQISITPQYNGNIQQLQLEIMAALYTGNIGRIAELLQLDIQTVE